MPTARRTRGAEGGFMTMSRVVARESFDCLPEDDPSAMRSRRDLRRVHHSMGTRSIVLRALRGMNVQCRDSAPLRLLELGAGDGSLMLGVARAIGDSWPRVALTLLNRQSLIGSATITSYAQLGWTATALSSMPSTGLRPRPRRGRGRPGTRS
jgi:hypothetical protein